MYRESYYTFNEQTNTYEPTSKWRLVRWHLTTYRDSVPYSFLVDIGFYLIAVGVLGWVVTHH
jgi:hypothetical protein